MNGSTPRNIRVAVTQAEPEWLDLEKCVMKTCTLIKDAAANGAKLVTFPEVWIPGYPAWVWYAAIFKGVAFIIIILGAEVWT